MSDIEFYHNYETESGISVPLVICMEYDTYVDRHYGADADGNRSTRMTELDCSPLSIQICDSWLEVGHLIKRDNPKLYKELEDMAEKKASEAFNQDDYDDRYYDDDSD